MARKGTPSPPPSRAPQAGRRPRRGRRSLSLLRTGGTVLVRWREASVLIVAIAHGRSTSGRPTTSSSPTTTCATSRRRRRRPRSSRSGSCCCWSAARSTCRSGVVAALAPFLVHYAVDFYGRAGDPGDPARVRGRGGHRVLQRLHRHQAAGAVAGGDAGLVLLCCSVFCSPPRTPTRRRSRRPRRAGSSGSSGAADWASLIWCLGVVVVFHVVLTRTRWGLHTISVGGNLIGATEAGIRVNRIKIGNFMIASHARRARRHPGGVPDQQHRPEHRRRHGADLHRDLGGGHRRHRPGRAAPAR